MAMARIRSLTQYEYGAGHGAGDGDGDSEDSDFEDQDSLDEYSRDEYSEDGEDSDDEEEETDSQDQDSQNEDSEEEGYSQGEGSQDEDSQDEGPHDEEFPGEDNFEYDDDFSEYDEYDEFDEFDQDDDNNNLRETIEFDDFEYDDNTPESTGQQRRNNTHKQKQQPVRRFADIEHLFTFPPFAFSQPVWHPPFHIHGSRGVGTRAELLRFARALGAVDPESATQSNQDSSPANNDNPGNSHEHALAAVVVLSAPTNTAVVQRIIAVLEAWKRVLATVEDEVLRRLPRERFIARDIAPRSVFACACRNNILQSDEEGEGQGADIPRHHRCFAKDSVWSKPWVEIRESVVCLLIRSHQRRLERQRGRGEGQDWVLELQHNKAMLRAIVEFVGINYVNSGNLREGLDAGTEAERYCCELALGVLINYRDFRRYPAFLADFEEWKQRKDAGVQIDWPMVGDSGESLVYPANLNVDWGSEMAYLGVPVALLLGEDDEEEAQPGPVQIDQRTRNITKKRRRRASPSSASSSTVVARRSKGKQVARGEDRPTDTASASSADESDGTIGEFDGCDRDHEEVELAASFEPSSPERPLRSQSAPSTPRERSKATKKDNKNTPGNSKPRTKKQKKNRNDDTSQHSTSASQQRRDSRGRFITEATSATDATAIAGPSSSATAARKQKKPSASRAARGSRARAPATSIHGGGDDQASSMS